MPSLQDAINTDRSNLTPIESAQTVQQKPAPRDQHLDSLLKSPYARCPLPPSNNSADSLRQWGQGNEVPKFRTLTPPPNSGISSGTGGTVNESVFVNGGSSATVTVINLATAQNASISTPALTPGQVWQGTIRLAKAFQVQTVTGSAPCRVELYGTKAAQMSDLSRPVGQTPANSTQAIIMDVVLQGASLTWDVVSCVGNNADENQSSTIYITITNLSTAVQMFTASLIFVPLQQ